MTLCFATNNLNKLKEVASAVGNNFKILSLKELSVVDELPETHNTFEGNALQKAQFVFDKLTIPCFADDSGLEVDALSGEPGVYSAMYAGPQRDDQANIDLLLSKLKEEKNRAAKFKTVIALTGFGEPVFFEGVVPGKIADAPSGHQGFGYDPIFIPDGHSRTFAQMSLQEKNSLSHRAIATAKLITYLRGFEK
jgi:XTP/dITP diphosphohydrolase